MSSLLSSRAIPQLLSSSTFISSMTEAVDFLAGVAGPEVKLVLDLGRVGLNSEDLEKIDRWIDRAAVVQVADFPDPRGAD